MKNKLVPWDNPEIGTIGPFNSEMVQRNNYGKSDRLQAIQPSGLMPAALSQPLGVEMAVS